MTEKGKFLKKFNEAFAKADTQFIAESVTQDIQWTMFGGKTVHGLEEFKKEIESMVQSECGLELDKIITHGNTAAVNGIIKAQDKNGNPADYAFCDVYTLSGFKNPKIKEMKSYVIKIK
ncbi:nuclear transport factor 2 family protein [Flagellimonas sp.]|uniref:nuclear transport factor 2 family protein n=1 Tax=Flagellimonas sp. TaxID=2058762 RepID=UPI003AB4E205